MTGDRCHRRWKMMCRVSDGAEDNPCPISRVPKEQPLGLDFYTQAKKALSQRSPFDTEEAEVSNLLSVPTELSNLLSRDLDNRKRHRTPHPGPARKARGAAIWAETEEYFRDFTFDDVDKLHKLCSLGVLGSEKCFLIPKVGDAVLGLEECGLVNCDVGVEDSVEKGDNCSIREENECSSSGLEWLLGCKEKVHLTTERPWKKRKLLGGNAELKKLLVPIKGSLPLCDYCCLGDTGDELNRLIVCCSCDMTVHLRCYGVHNDVTSSWSCDWCKSSDLAVNHERPCVLCPKKGGALKPVYKKDLGSENCGANTEFAHLFCCQWIPEVYIQDTRTMEPVMNIQGIKDTRMKLLCNVCKVKYGACVRCSNGTCRTSFHPICAREAGNRMEIWGRFGFEDVELRAYCSKHSKGQNSTHIQLSEQLCVASCSDSHDTKVQTMTPMLKKPHILKIGRKNGDKVAVVLEPTETEKPRNDLLHEEGLFDSRSNSRFQFQYGKAQRTDSPLGSMTNDDVSTSDSTNYTMILKKLIDRGKVNLEDIASEIGVSTEALALISSDNHVAPDLQSKIVDWLKNNAHVASLQKNIKVRIKSSLIPKNDREAVGDANSALVASSDDTVKSVSAHKKTNNKIKIMKGNKVVCSVEGETGDELVIDKAKSCEVVTEDTNNALKENLCTSTEKLVMEPDGSRGKEASNSLKLEESIQEQGPALQEHTTVLNSVSKQFTCSISKSEVVSASYIHPVISEKMVKMQISVLPVSATCEVDGSRDREISSSEVSSSLNELIEHLISSDKISIFDRSKLEQLADPSNMGLLITSPEDEVEGELLFNQHRLLANGAITKRIADNLIVEMVKSIPQEIDVTSKRNWDAVIVNQYMSELKEAKRQERKERRHMEAQSVLSAATAVAAASPRISSLRKDTNEESVYQESLMKADTSTERPGLYSQPISRVKEKVSKSADPRGSPEMKSGSNQAISNCIKEHFRTCDICRRTDTLLNPILVCSGCKAAVHLDCYRSGNDSTGLWYCELCEEELSSRRPQVAVECRLCGDSTGAFRKSADGQWVHAFCAEWVLEGTFKRGQTTHVEGVESVVKGSECHVCHRKLGACIKCNYGNCYSMFHPSCARSAGLYMNVKSSGSKLQHKAYCQNHSMEQRAKTKSQRHGIEELKSLKQIRVELERLRLLCERITKREKLKRELVLCSQDILVSDQDTAAMSALVRSPFFPADTSSESATTSLRGNTDDCRSGSEAIQISDDVTVDSTVPGKRRIKFPLSKNKRRKTDEISASHMVIQKPRERFSFAGKQIPPRPSSVSQNLPNGDGERKSQNLESYN